MSDEDRPKLTWTQSFASASGVVVRHARKHVGVGLVCSIAYFDPGNWAVDLQAGSDYGYRLLFVVLISGLLAVFLQVLAGRLGCVTGLDLASHCRLLLYSHARHPRLIRWLALYPLYILAEVAIIATDLAELLGSAMALCMLFPKLQIWQGVLITAADVLFLLALKDPLRGRPVRMFELGMGALVLAVLICMCIIISRVQVQWDLAFQGYLPSKYIFPNGAFYTSVGILGSTVMPHSLFLGSTLATQDREPPEQVSHSRSLSQQLSTVSTLSTIHFAQITNEAIKTPEHMATRKLSIRRIWKRFCNIHRSIWLSTASMFQTPPDSTMDGAIRHHGDRENNSVEFVRRHLYHGIVDMVSSLLGFAVVINSLILILSSAVFYYGAGQSQNSVGLFDAYDLIRTLVGKGPATLFAIALLAAGQSSSIVATIAGQAVAEGFMRWRMSPVLRRLFTRVIAVIPSMAIAICMGRSGIDTLLVVSQVILSIVLPFITLPLVYLTSSKKYMTVKCRVNRDRTFPSAMNTEGCGGVTSGASTARQDSSHGSLDEPQTLTVHNDENVILHDFPLQVATNSVDRSTCLATTFDPFTAMPATESGSACASGSEVQYIDYSNGPITTLVAYALWSVIVLANVYVVVALAMGQGS